MAQYEQPVNQINFSAGEQPENKRIEEQFMYKYMEMRPEKVVKSKNLEEANTGPEDDESNIDVEMEKFADEEMEREMARMVQGAPGGMPDSDDEDVPIDISDDEEGDGEEGDFFSGEDDLQDVEIEGDDDDDDDDDEGEDLFSQGGSEEEEVSEAAASDNEGSELPQEEQVGAKKGQNKKRMREEMVQGKNIKKTKQGTKYASYEDFADLLEGDLDAENDKPIKKHKLATTTNYSMQKRKRTKWFIRNVFLFGT